MSRMRMIRPAGVLALAWLAAAAAWFLLGAPARRGEVGWTATRPLAANTQLRDADLAGPTLRHELARSGPRAALVGQHLLSAKNAGDRILPADVSAEPVFPVCEPKSGVLIYSLEGEEQLADAVDVGSWVIPCYVRPGASERAAMSTVCASASVAVEAVHRPRSAGDSTWVALRVPNCRVGDIGEHLAREHRFLLVAANAPPVSDMACPAGTR